MNRIKFTLILGTLFAAAAPVWAAASPQDTVSSMIDGNKITIVYCRPYTKDPKTGEPRQIWGKLVPYGQVWRTGANAATTLTTEQTITIGDATVPAGKYTLYSIPEENGSSKLIINKQTGQWGTQYSQDQDLARVDLKQEKLDPPVHQFTIALEKQGDGDVLKLMWEDRTYSVPVKVKK